MSIQNASGASVEPNLPDADDASALLRLTGLAAVRGERQLFSQVEATLRPGEVLQLKGANGSGKTTLLRIIAGLTEPSDGEVFFRGQKLRHCREEYGRHISWYGHAHGLKEELTVAENLYFYRALGGFHEARTVQNAMQALAIESLGDLSVSHLSAGQKRRASLARLCLKPATLWLLDEPYTNLDSDSSARVSELIAEHIARGGACVLAAHELPGADERGWRVYDLESRS